MMTHKTKGIVLRTLKYGETSIITSVYTESFGIQSYIVKGVRQSKGKSQPKSNYFQPCAILALEVYHNELKNLQFIKEYQWDFLYEHIFFDVVKNTVALFSAELLLHTLKQPEPNSSLYTLMENTLKTLDNCDQAYSANLPAFFSLQLSGELGFSIQGGYSKMTPVLDLREGMFVNEIPSHPEYATGEVARLLSTFNSQNDYRELQTIHIKRSVRRVLLRECIAYIALHVEDFTELKTLNVLQEVLD